MCDPNTLHLWSLKEKYPCILHTLELNRERFVYYCCTWNVCVCVCECIMQYLLLQGVSSLQSELSRSHTPHTLLLHPERELQQHAICTYLLTFAYVITPYPCARGEVIGCIVCHEHKICHIFPLLSTCGYISTEWKFALISEVCLTLKYMYMYLHPSMHVRPRAYLRGMANHSIDCVIVCAALQSVQNDALCLKSPRINCIHRIFD